MTYDACPHCKATTIDLDPLFFSTDDGNFCLVCGGRVLFNRNGKAIKTVMAARVFLCIHDHKHRTKAAHDRCVDGAAGAATGSRLALR